MAPEGGIRARWRRFLLRRRAWRLLKDLFDAPERLEGTSLRTSHRGRVNLTDLETDAGVLKAFRFTILRHPRPYAFSRQYHAVMQLYRYDLGAERIEHVRSLNLSRAAGRDGEPPGSGAGGGVI